jgi:hypothetical protein
MSTERLRETIRKEDALAKAHHNPSDNESSGDEEGWAHGSGGLAAQNLFDVVNRVPDVSLKYRRDDRQVRRPTNARTAWLLIMAAWCVTCLGG